MYVGTASSNNNCCLKLIINLLAESLRLKVWLSLIDIGLFLVVCTKSQWQKKYQVGKDLAAEKWPDLMKLERQT